MTVLMFAAVALVGYRLWMRIREAETTIEKLTARVAALELTLPIDVRQARAPEPSAVDVRPPQPLREPSPDHVPQCDGAQEPESPKPVVAPPVVVASLRTPSVESHALESQIGSRWLLYVGVVAIVIGVSYFEKLAIENHWVNETWRVIQGGVAGLALVAGGLRIVKKGYRLYGQILAGAGVAIMYVSTYAAFNFYHLISHPVAFVVMLAITALSTWLAD
jgi:uncharacterized membrane protein